MLSHINHYVNVTMLYETLKANLKPLLPYAALLFIGVYGMELLANANLEQYRDGFMALIISLFMQPWIIYHLEN